MLSYQFFLYLYHIDNFHFLNFFSVIQSSFIINPLSTTLSVGANLLLFCLHSGSFPAASIIWTKNGSPLISGGSVTTSTEILQHTNPPQVCTYIRNKVHVTG